MGDSGGVFPFEGPVGIAALWEIPWMNDGLAVALMTIAWILLFRKIKADNPFYRRVLVPVSNAGYGMYLCHLLLLGAVSAWIRGMALPTPVQILATTVISFVGVALFAVLVRRIPKAGRLIIG